jgi:site-specific recombinase
MLPSIVQGATVVPDDIHHRARMAFDRTSLREHVNAFTAAGTLSERTDAFVALVLWTRRGSDADARLDGLLDQLDDPDERHRFQAAVGAVLGETDGTNVYAHAGIPSERGFPAELGERVMNHLLPRPRNDRDLGHLIRRLFRSAADANRLARMPEKRLVRLAHALYPAEDLAARESLKRSFADGFRLLATWVQAQGLSPKLRKRSHPCELTESPFYQMRTVSEAVVGRWFEGGPPGLEVEAWSRDCDRCREELQEVHQCLEREGVSTDVVYSLEVIERCLARMRAMVDVMAAPSGEPSPQMIRRVVVALATSVHCDRSVFHLIGWNTHLLQRRIVERSGRTGEHYVAATRAEYRQIWLAAAGGGLLTVGTAAIKTVVSAWHVSDFMHGFLYGLNYAVSFLLLQRFHLVLATKQPAMTAAALATIVRERRGQDRVNEIADYTARICRSQLAAVLGNVILVCIGAFAFVHLWSLMFGRPFLNETEASEIYAQLSPLSSGTVLYAALTGVILWLASVVGGWFDNFCAYHRLPLAIAQHPAGRTLGRDRLARWGERLADNASGWATNVSLGFMLGMTPAIGHFLGLPLDVRHVTLNSGILSLASTSLGHRWFGEGAFLLSVAGVGVMFVLNLSVSFLLALASAARAYELRARDNAELLGGLVRRFRRTPLDFFVPPRSGRPKEEATVAMP